ncbi:CarboxypepD_reg-like domain-containing protein [Candidatus Kryptonium thompsonii]|nr:CarboxypepD_reg-like domain-containing protein [Candidatus Kryptonium thompsoni]
MTKELLQIWILALFTILITQLLSAQVGTVSGFIYDQTSGIPLSFVNVWVKSTSRGTASNQDGYYILFLSPGKYLIVYSIVGYQRLEKEVVIRENENINLNVYLVPDSVEIDTVEVESLPNTNMEPRTIIVRRNEIEKIPPFLGEFDLLKTLPSFPGVVERDFSSRLYIQGGYPENNLILVDGVEFII